MHSFVIEGGRPLSGTITASGNKNAVLPLLAASLLTDEPVELSNVPRIRDVEVMLQILGELGVEISEPGPARLTLCARKLKSHAPPPDLCRELRASFLLVGPLLARLGRAELPSPGGDRIGRRPLDAHILALGALGAQMTTRGDCYRFEAPHGLHGAEVFLQEMSVMATENAVMAAAAARGETVLMNAASEPHIQDLCTLLVSMGATIEGIGTNTLRIVGRPETQGGLHGGTGIIGSDYVEVGSFIALAAVTKGAILIKNARPRDHRAVAVAYGTLGVRWEARGEDIFVPAEQELVVKDGLHGQMPRIHDAPWPGFPPDLTSIALVLATQARGTVLIHEWMYESRLFWVDRLLSMGARVVICDPHRAVVVGRSQLYGQFLSGPDIRAGMALLIAALTAEGKSVIHNAHHIDRGYQDIEVRLRALGADIHRAESRRTP
jgi:UDP-N-acetylglucosamine 1-carboxyvinyltransferase